VGVPGWCDTRSWSRGAARTTEAPTTHHNGLAGFWLPRDVEGAIDVAYDGKSVPAPLATGPEGPTCITAVQLT